jgi:hypothetical protein
VGGTERPPRTDIIPTSEANTATAATRALFGVESRLDFLKFNRGESSRFFGISLFLVFNSFLLDAVEVFESDGVFYFLTHLPRTARRPGTRNDERQPIAAWWRQIMPGDCSIKFSSFLLA